MSGPEHRALGTRGLAREQGSDVVGREAQDEAGDREADTGQTAPHCGELSGPTLRILKI